MAGVPMSPKTISEFQGVAAPATTFSRVGEFGGLGEIVFARPEDEMEMEIVGYKGSVNPYLNSPPSPPRYFYPRSDDEEEEGVDRPSLFYTLERSRSPRRPIGQRSFSDQCQSAVERKSEGPLASPRYFASLGRNVGSRPKEKGEFFLSFFLFHSRNPA